MRGGGDVMFARPLKQRRYDYCISVLNRNQIACVRFVAAPRDVMSHELQHLDDAPLRGIVAHLKPVAAKLFLLRMQFVKRA
jgi:hypothetical protein